MNTRIEITSCPTCAKPLVKVFTGDARIPQWYAIHENTIYLGDDEHLIWCPGCAVALPAAPAVAVAGTMLTEAVTA